jgi:hypothetical protein
MSKLVKIVGVVRIGYGICGIMTVVGIVALATALLTGLVWYGVLSMSPRNIVIISTPVVLFLMICSVTDIISGRGILRQKPWAWNIVIVRAVMDLFVFPIGTALGIYSIWGLTHDVATEQVG